MKVKDNIVIYVVGGVVQSIWSDNPNIKVNLFDYDVFDYETKKAIDRLNQVIDDYINIFDTDKKEIKEIEQSLKVLIKKTESEE